MAISVVPCPTPMLAVRRPGRRREKCVRIRTDFAKSQSLCSYPLFLLPNKRSVYEFHIAICQKCTKLGKISQDSDTFCWASYTWPTTSQYSSRTCRTGNQPTWPSAKQSGIERKFTWIQIDTDIYCIIVKLISED